MSGKGYPRIHKATVLKFKERNYKTNRPVRGRQIHIA